MGPGPSTTSYNYVKYIYMYIYIYNWHHVGIWRFEEIAASVSTIPTIFALRFCDLCKGRRMGCFAGFDFTTVYLSSEGGGTTTSIHQPFGVLYVSFLVIIMLMFCEFSVFFFFYSGFENPVIPVSCSIIFAQMHTHAYNLHDRPWLIMNCYSNLIGLPGLLTSNIRIMFYLTKSESRQRWQAPLMWSLQGSGSQLSMSPWPLSCTNL